MQKLKKALNLGTLLLLMYMTADIVFHLILNINERLPERRFVPIDFGFGVLSIILIALLTANAVVRRNSIPLKFAKLAIIVSAFLPLFSTMYVIIRRG